MTLRVSGKNIAIGEALRSHVHKRVDGLVAKYNAGTATGHVTIEPEGSGFRADCTLFFRGGVTLQVEALAHEPYASFDKATDRIERRLRDHRKRSQDRHGNGHANGIPADGMQLDGARVDGHEADGFAFDGADGAAPIAFDEGADGDEANPAGTESFPAVIAERADAVAKMTVAAAVRALDETACPVVVFRYAENSRINVVYRRADGNIGWIDPLAGAGS